MRFSLPALNTLLLPIGLLLVAHVLVFAWRALPPDSKHTEADSQWQKLTPLNGAADVRQQLLAGGHWGVPEAVKADTETSSADELDKLTAEATRTALSQRLQARLQGIIYRGEWVLLFAHDTDDASQAEDTKDNQSTSRPLELRNGDVLPGTNWQIGRTWPDRVELQHQQQPAIILPLYPLADPATEP